jgi:CubicO group peptidase (beta-lactamase class C family)
MLKFKKTPYVAKFHDKYFHSENSKINDQFFIGSVTKVFTSTLIFNLQKQKLLNIDDKVSKYLDNFSFNKDITIKELLTHTSGIREDESKFMIDSFQKQKEHFPISKVLKYAHQTKDKNYVYTNVNYMILGEIIKKITNQSFEKYVHKIIIKPLHLENTCIIYKDKNCNPTR